MKVVRYFSKKKKISLIVVLVFISSMNLTRYIQNIEENDPTNSITAVKASHNQSSYSPRVFHSGSGRVHVLFRHVMVAWDQIGASTYYHSYELEDGSWAIPTKVIGYKKIYGIEPSEKGFVIYYFSSGLYKLEYDEGANKWNNPVELFGKSQILSFLNIDLPEDQQGRIHVYFHSALLLEDEGFFTVWSFKDLDDNESVRQFFISNVVYNGSIVSQRFYGLKGWFSSIRPNFVRVENNIFLYNRGYTERATLFSNGTWSNWHDSFISISNPILLKNRFLFGDFTQVNTTSNTTESTRWIFDLVMENLIGKTLDPPYIQGRISIYPDESSQSGDIFLIASTTNGTIDLWRYDYLKNHLSHKSSLDSKNSLIFRFEPGNLEILPDKGDWRVFWDQKGIKDMQSSGEIFTATYHEPIDNWSPISQVTYTETITDDHTHRLMITSEDTMASSFGFFIVLTGLFVGGLLLKLWRDRKKSKR